MGAGALREESSLRWSLRRSDVSVLVYANVPRGPTAEGPQRLKSRRGVAAGAPKRARE